MFQFSPRAFSAFNRATSTTCDTVRSDRNFLDMSWNHTHSLHTDIIQYARQTGGTAMSNDDTSFFLVDCVRGGKKRIFNINGLIEEGVKMADRKLLIAEFVAAIND